MISFSNYNAHSIDIFKQLNILPLNKLVVHKNKIGIMMYKYANNRLPPVINEMYTTNSDIHNYTSRQKELLHVKSFVNTSARIWNAMQSEIGVNGSISKFKMSSLKFAKTYTSCEIFKIGLLYNVSCTGRDLKTIQKEKKIPVLTIGERFSQQLAIPLPE